MECLNILNALVCIVSIELGSMHGFPFLSAVCSFRASLKLPFQDKQLPSTMAKDFAARNGVAWNSQ